MKVYRIGRTQYADDVKGEGARLFGGRWNHKSIPCIYTSESRALALLEYTVNVNIKEIPRRLRIATFEIPDKGIKIISGDRLPGDWKEAPAPKSCKDFGTRLLASLSNAVFKIPSAIITEEYNFLLNPMHVAACYFTIIDIKNFVYDIRIKKV
ncbi:MAG: RES family NAD+ phosphorylase [Ginsengibacter sp.]